MPAIDTASRDRSFVVLWIGQTLSVFGSAVSMLALPTVAVLVLHATPFQLGVLEALAYAGFPTLGLIVGVIADRMRRRRIMIVADFGRALLLASIPLAAALGMLSFAQLAAVALATGIGSVFFDISYQSYVPSIVAKRDLSAANARLEFTRSIAEIAGTGIAGLLISSIGAARTVAVDAASFLVSVASLLAIRAREATRAPTVRSTTFIADLREGLSVVLGSPVLRTIAGCTATSNFASSMLSAVLLIFAYRDLHLRPVTVGIVYACANIGFVGAALATRAARRFGLGPTLAFSSLLGGIGPLLLPFARLGAPAIVLFFVVLIPAIAVPIYNINQVSLRQTIVAEALQGRMNATMRTIVWGTMPFGAITGGALGNVLGVVPTIFTAGVFGVSACLWIFLGPARSLRSIEHEATRE